MVRLDEVTATLNTLDQLSTTLEEGIEQYKHHVGVLRGQVQKIGARLSQYSSDAYKAIPGASSKDIDVINQLVAKVSSRFGKILNWRKGSSPTPSQSQGPKNASAHYSSRPTPSPPPSASTTEDPATKSNGDCETDSGIKRLTTEERLAQNERQLQAQLLQLDPDEMWAEIAQIWMKITWARSVFRHLPVDPVLKVRALVVDHSIYRCKATFTYHISHARLPAISNWDHLRVASQSRYSIGDRQALQDQERHSLWRSACFPVPVLPSSNR